MKYFKLLLLVCLSSGLLKTLLEFKDFHEVGIVSILLIILFFGWLIYLLYKNTSKEFEQNILLYLVPSVLVLTFLISSRNYLTTGSNSENSLEEKFSVNFDNNTNNSKLGSTDFEQIEEGADMTIDAEGMMMDTDTSEMDDNVIKLIIEKANNTKLQEENYNSDKLNSKTTSGTNTVIVKNNENINLLNFDWENFDLQGEKKSIRSLSIFNKTQKIISSITVLFEVKNKYGDLVDSGKFTISSKNTYFEEIDPRTAKVVYISGVMTPPKRSTDILTLTILSYN